jgi:hypothetical protein
MPLPYGTLKTSTDTRKLERIQRKFVALCQYRFFTHDHGTYEDCLKFLKLHTLHNGRIRLDALFFTSVYSNLKCCPFLLDTTGIRVLPRNFRNSSLFTATCKNSVSEICFGCKTDIFRTPIISLKQILR